MKEIGKIGVYTSGGDAPGMNACIRAVVRSALSRDIGVMGIRRGYSGMIEGDFVDMDRHSVSNILQLGGTILKSARSMEFKTEDGRKQAANHLQKAGIEALVAIGGDGTFTGASVFNEEFGIPVVGCPGTIDNDLFGTDDTIGYDTAMNTALENIDKIRDTADAHNRLFLIEVMGRDSGFIALQCAVAGGAEVVLIPETISDLTEIKAGILQRMTGHKRSSIAIIAEGDTIGGAQQLHQALRDDSDFDNISVRVTVLGHIQRGGSPSARDRVLASRLGSAAVDALLDGHTAVMVGVVADNIKLTPLKNIRGRKKTINLDMLDLIDQLS